jgi:hypothetical protein
MMVDGISDALTLESSCPIPIYEVARPSAHCRQVERNSADARVMGIPADDRALAVTSKLRYFILGKRTSRDTAAITFRQTRVSGGMLFSDRFCEEVFASRFTARCFGAFGCDPYRSAKLRVNSAPRKKI